MPNASTSSPAITKAVIPAAGFGTRLLPVTKCIPKEMLPVGSKPVIQHVVEEAVASGLTEICIVIREGKELIKDYFLGPVAETADDDKSIAELERLVRSCQLTFVYQRRPLGMGDALLAARDFVGSDPFVLLVPDQLMCAFVPAPKQLLDRWQPGAAVWTSLIRLPKAETSFFDSSRGFDFRREVDSDRLIVGRIRTVEETERAYEGLDYEVRGFGRTIYPPEIFDYFGSDYLNPRTGEVDLLRTFEAFTERLGHRGVMLEGEPFDLGTLPGYQRYLPRLWELHR